MYAWHAPLRLGDTDERSNTGQIFESKFDRELTPFWIKLAWISSGFFQLETF